MITTDYFTEDQLEEFEREAQEYGEDFFLSEDILRDIEEREIEESEAK